MYKPEIVLKERETERISKTFKNNPEILLILAILHLLALGIVIEGSLFQTIRTVAIFLAIDLSIIFFMRKTQNIEVYMVLAMIANLLGATAVTLWDFKITDVHCKVYDKVKKECVEYDPAIIEILLKRPASFYTEFKCQIFDDFPLPAIPIGSLDEIGDETTCYPKGNKLIVKISPEFAKERRLYLGVKASKGKIEEETSLVSVFLEKRIDKSTRKM